MAKGTYTALQQLKPAEIKVGEFYNNWVDGYVRRGEANRAAQAKLLAEQKKEIGERFNSMKLDPYATLANFSDFAQNSFIETADFVGTQRLLADKDPANAREYLMRAENAVADYRSLAATFGNKDFIEKANAKQQALANNDVFSETDNNEQLAILGQAIPEYRRDPNTGRMKFGLPKSGVATDEDPLEWKSTGEIVSLWTSPDEINLLRSNKSNGNNGFLDKQVFDVAKKMADEYSTNYDGNRTNAKTWFSEKRGNQWFDSTFGEFNPNNIPPVIKQYAKSVLKKSINGDDAEAVYAEAKKGIINNIASLVGTETKVDTKETALDRQEQIARIRKLNERESPTQVANTSPSSGTFQMQVKDSKGNIVGYKQQVGAVVPLDKKGNYIALAQSYDPKTKKYYNSYMVAKPNPTGEIVMSAPMNKGQWEAYLRQQGKNPVVELNNLMNNLPEKPNLWQPKVFQKVKSNSDNVYTKMEFFNPSEYKDKNAVNGYDVPFGQRQP